MTTGPPRRTRIGLRSLPPRQPESSTHPQHKNAGPAVVGQFGENWLE